MKGLITERLHFRHPSKADGAALWQMVKESGTLDVNSPYFYIAMSHWFSYSCLLVEDADKNIPIGMIVGFRQPSNLDTLFIWQITVHHNYRGSGIAMQLLNRLVAGSADIQYVEATISPSNGSSIRLFEKWAAAWEAAMVQTPCLGTEVFPDEVHEQEDLYRIGPLNKLRQEREERND